jgi:Glycosyltransferase family 87
MRIALTHPRCRLKLQWRRGGLSYGLQVTERPRSTDAHTAVSFSTQQAQEARRVGDRGGAKKWRSFVVWVSATAGSFVAVLAMLLFVGGHISLPNEHQQDAWVNGGLNVAVRELVGRGDPTDFLVDFASAHALMDGGDPYAISAKLIHGVGPDWPVNTANPHPPTVLMLVLPIILLPYDVALAAWALAMIYVFVGTIRLLGVRLHYAIPLGIAIGLTFPGAYGILNPVPIIGLGVAMAYRWRDTPMVAALGVALAAAPKSSGLVLIAPFLLAGRLRTVGWTALWYGLLAMVPLAIDHQVWTNYFPAAMTALRLNAARAGNASLLHLGRSWGISEVVTVGIIGIVVAVVALARRDLFWPVAFATVAVLPVAWMYSLLTFLPLIVWAVVRSPRRSAGLAVIAGALTVSSAPLGPWGPITYPIVTVVVLLLLVTAEADMPREALWLLPRFDPFKSWPVLDISPHRLQGQPSQNP